MLDAIRDAFLNFQDVGQHVGFVLERAFQRVLEEIRMTTSKDEDELLLLLFEVEKMVDTCWQQLHVVHYAQVPRIWREMYTFCVALKSEILLLTIDDADNLNRVVKMKREAVWWLDMGLVMAGAPVLRREILDRVVELQHDLNHLRHMKRVKRLFPVVSRELALERKRDIGFPVQAFQADRVDWDTYRVLASSQRPFLLKNALESHGWPALEKWRDMAYLLETVGEDRVVPVEIGRAYTEEGWTQKLMRFGEFMQQYILNEDQERKGYLAQHNLFHQLPHLERETCPPDYACLEFGDKGMISSRDLIVNTWFGPADTISPLHTDPYDNLFAQVVGFKYLRLYAPEEGQKLFPYPSESLVSNTSQIVDVDRVSDEMSNTFQQARYVETIVGPGDLLYSCVHTGGLVALCPVSIDIVFHQLLALGRACLFSLEIVSRMPRAKPEEPENDLIYLGTSSEAELVNVLNERFARDKVYTRIGERVLVAVNPNKPLENGTESSLKAICSAVKDGTEREPHVFELASNAYYTMTNSKQDQAILFLGESGSGKTEAYNNALKALVAVSKSKRRDEKTSRRILSTSAVLEAFGTAKTIQNDSSSRFGKVVEVQFNSRGRLAGLKIMDYLLERPRVAHVQYSERNFNVFYYMLAGLSSEERAKWNLLDPHKYVALAATKGRPSATDVNGFAELKTALKVLGFKDKYQSQIFQLLSAILHLGNVQFEMGKNKEEAAKVKNYEALENVAELLGLRPTHLENALVYKTKLIKKELCTMFLDPDESSEQRHLLMQTLYSLLWSWVVEAMNKRLDQEEPANVVTLVDMFGIDNLKANYFHQLLYNYTFEKLLEFTNKTLFDAHVDQCKGEGVGLASVSYSDNSEILKLFTGTPSGVLTLLNEEAAKGRKKAKISTLIETWNSEFESNKSWIAFPKKSKSYLFGIRHHVTDVNYDAAEFVDNNSENISADFVTLFRGGPDTRPSKNTFIQGLFTERALNLERNPQNSKAVVGAMQTNSPRRKPSVRRPKKGESSSRDKETAPTFASHYQDALNLAFECLNESELSFVYCLRSNGKQSPSRFETTTVTAQVSTLGLSDVVSMRRAGYGLSLPFDQFVERYRLALSDAGMLEGARSPEKALRLIEGVGLSAEDALMGQKRVFLTDAALRLLTFKLRRAEKAERKRLKEKVKVSGGDMLNLSVADGGSQVSSHVDEEQSDWNSEVDDESQTGTETVADDASNYGSEYSYMSEAEDDLKKGAEQELDFEEEEEEISGVRRWWLRTTTFLTWWIPSRCLEWNGMKRADIQQAWREKLALCILIFFLSAVTLFFITGFSLILCPRDDLYDLGELSNHNDVNADLWMAVWGSIYDVTVLRRTHSTGPELMDDFAGQDASECFLLDPSLCGLEANPLLTFNSTKCWNHDLGSSLPILNPKNRRIWKGYLAHRKDSIARDHGKADSWWIINDGNVYDMTNYRKTNQKYLGDDVTSIVYQFPGSDATAAFKRIGTKGRAALNCMNKIHFVGKVDTRDSPQCLFANTLLLAATGVLVGITVIKFLSALQLGSKGDPEDHDRFVICMVPCYTEGEESLRRTIDSLATLRYDDKRKLLMLVADGNIIGSGNDRATWRIALDLLGVDPTIDPPKLSFQSLGEGNLQHNMGKVYTGLYDCSGHLVPYMVVVKVGKDNETRRPGNRGKRDSQMVLMRFLQKVHYDESMSPLELEMYHQMKNVIGVDPSFYEFVLMVDADTEVVQDSLNRMISFMVHDAKVLGLCGETLLANEKGSVITMVQVYEYYISHHLAKAFESLFGSVTCLPGCFCMYRIRSPNKSIPLLIAKPVISDYGVNNVDTLHKKNLLSLGEDRYLTTLMLKHFPNMKISFTPHAQAKTYAPDRWSILLSQRRRWINSTIHNLAELLLLPQLCGFCCFSMRFVVFFDLFATLVMPATMAYLAYLIYEAIRNQFFPLVSLIMLCVAYGLQIIIFLLRGKFEHIGWLVIYLLALPFFTFIIPMYSFWHFDDFSWGNTRVVVGERGGKKQIIDEEPFDPSSIPMKRWSDYEQEMWEEESKATSVTKPHQPEEYAKSAFSHHTRPAHSLVGPIYPPAGYPVPPEYAAAMYQQQQMPVPGEIHSQRSSVIQPVRPVTMISSEEYPTNEQIVAQVKTILSTADLMTVTKKQVRDELSMFFGVDMTSRKEFINKVIEDVLQGKM